MSNRLNSTSVSAEQVSFFPLFINLNAKHVLVAGGGEVAFRKVSQLLEFGAAVTVVSPQYGERLRLLSGTGTISVIQRDYCSGDIADAVLAVAATDCRVVNRQIYDDASAAGIPVNVVDDPELCSFYFPSIVRRGPLVFGISTSGRYPLIAKTCRQQIEAEFPAVYGLLTQQLGRYRLRLSALESDREAVRNILGKILDYGLSLIAPGSCRISDSELEQLLDVQFEELMEQR
jgi:siroheme synthase-like protein